MILKRVLSTVIGIATLATAASVAIVAAAFGLFAWLSDYMHPAAAAGLLAGVAALVAAITGTVLLRKPGKKPEALKSDDSLTAKLIDLARERPIVAVGAVLAVGAIAFRNPKLVTALLTGVLAGRAAPKN